MLEQRQCTQHAERHQAHLLERTDIRRGKSSVHNAFGENIALLTGDALILKASATLASAFRSDPASLGTAVGIFTNCSGLPSGVAIGHAWEIELDALSTNARAED